VNEWSGIARRRISDRILSSPERFGAKRNVYWTKGLQMPDKIHVEFGRPSSGSMLTTLQVGESSLEVWASYIPYDSITELAGALSLIMKGGPEAKVSWNEEPTEYDFVFTARENDAQLDVFTYPDSSRARRGRKKILSFRGTIIDICQPFWRALRRLETSIPLNEYKAAWGHRFPEGKMREVTELVEQMKPRHGN